MLSVFPMGEPGKNRRRGYTSLMIDESAYLNELETWRREAEKSLRAQNSWLALAGLHWLSEGSHNIGSRSSHDVVLPEAAPATVGILSVSDSRVTFEPHPEAEVLVDGQPARQTMMQPDMGGEPTLLEVGPLAMIVIKRGSRRALRVWDNARPELDAFPGRRWYPADLACRVVARFETPDNERIIIVPNETGTATEEPVAGEVEFELMGQRARLTALHRGEEQLFLIFGDDTNGDTTYRPGRFLVAGPPADGSIVIDFNYAYNPPCAFTTYATCSLPPPQNVLQFPIRAGELAPPA